MQFAGGALVLGGYGVLLEGGKGVVGATLVVGAIVVVEGGYVVAEVVVGAIVVVDGACVVVDGA